RLGHNAGIGEMLAEQEIRVARVFVERLARADERVYRPPVVPRRLAQRTGRGSHNGGVGSFGILQAARDATTRAAISMARHAWRSRRVLRIKARAMPKGE